MSEINQFEREEVTKNFYRFVNSEHQLIVGQNQPILLANSKIRPDIVMYQNNNLIGVIQIKIYLTNGTRELEAELVKLNSIKESNSDLKALFIFYMGHSNRIIERLNAERREKVWFNYLILQNNEELLYTHISPILPAF